MTSFVVLQHNEEPQTKATEKTVFVRDALSVVALAVPILWLFWHRLWIAGLYALIGFIAVGIFAQQNPNHAWVLMVFNILLSIYVAVEGPTLRMAMLKLSSYKQRGVVDAENLEDAEIIWAMRGQSAMAESDKSPKTEIAPSQQNNLIFGANGSN